VSRGRRISPAGGRARGRLGTPRSRWSMETLFGEDRGATTAALARLLDVDARTPERGPGPQRGRRAAQRPARGRDPGPLAGVPLAWKGQHEPLTGRDALLCQPIICRGYRTPPYGHSQVAVRATAGRPARACRGRLGAAPTWTSSANGRRPTEKIRVGQRATHNPWARRFFFLLSRSAREPAAADKARRRLARGLRLPAGLFTAAKHVRLESARARRRCAGLRA